MTTVSSPNADIAHQARASANRAASSSTTAKGSEAPADPFAALFDAAMLQQTDPQLATETPALAGAPLPLDKAVTPEDEAAVVTDAPMDPATLLASLTWPLSGDAPAPAVPTEGAAPDATAPVDDDAAAGLAAAAATIAAPAVAAPILQPAVVAEVVPGNQAASGVRRAGQALGATSLGVEARSGSAATDADADTGKDLVTDSIDPTSPGASTALQLAAAANATAAAAVRNQTTATTDPGLAPSAGVLTSDTSATHAAASVPGAQAAARSETPTVPGAPVPLHAPQLQARVDDAVRWMSTQSIQTAEIRVTPDDLGPITVHLRMEGDIANVSFSSEHAQTRQALEASMGGLRTALGENGLQLGQAQVGSEQQNQQAFAAFANAGGEDRRGRQAAADRMQAAVSALGERPPVPKQSGTGLVDLYA
jgi:flagellar hook-length control protein FliK